MDFGEKEYEFSARHGKEIPVWQSPKYRESKKKAIEIIESGKYGLSESDFWILMNVTKSDKMAYTGLILSHNGCLKINDTLSSKFDPDCVAIDKDGYNGSLVYSYCNKEQGIYEVGEVSAKNCKNEYPYAMALKRLFDRVILKISKLAYAGIYSENEADEFAERLEAADRVQSTKSKTKTAVQDTTPIDTSIKCAECGSTILPVMVGGKEMPVSEILELSKRFNRPMCAKCQRKEEKRQQERQKAYQDAKDGV